MRTALFLLVSVFLSCGGAIAAESPLVELDARQLTSGMEAWQNHGTMGGAFMPIGRPLVQEVKNVRAITFDGVNDAYLGPKCPPNLADRAMVFKNLITGWSLDEAHERCSFATPAINEDAGYLQVTRLNGAGPALLVLPGSLIQL